MSNIKFGTDGWRAILDKEFNQTNVDKVTNAIAIYTYDHNQYDKKILISYDPRNKADYYAFYIASKLSDFGFNIEIADKITATPVLAYSALKHNAYAIMLTASHNPPEYLGIKFIPDFGGPAEDETVEEIISNLEKTFDKKNKLIHNPMTQSLNSPQTKDIKAIESTESKLQDFSNYKKTSFEEEYVEHIKSIINFKKIKNSKISINYDGHHGAAAKLFEKILKNEGVTINTLNMERDINFGGFMPDPKEKYLPELKQECFKTGLIGLSNDGDGDRFGVFNEKGEFVSANEIIAILLKHLKINKGLNGKLAKTVGASSMLDIAAKNTGTEIIETPVGFKWLGATMRKDNILIAGEESGGLSIKGHIPEKDGILANLLIMEAIAFSGKKLYELQEELKKTIGRNFINERIDLKLNSTEEQENIINKFKQYKEIGKYKIVKTNSLDGYKIYLNEGSTILIRKSGTEPLLRIYFETDMKDKNNELQNITKSMI